MAVTTTWIGLVFSFETIISWWTNGSPSMGTFCLVALMWRKKVGKLDYEKWKRFGGKWFKTTGMYYTFTERTIVWRPSFALRMSVFKSFISNEILSTKYVGERIYPTSSISKV